MFDDLQIAHRVAIVRVTSVNKMRDEARSLDVLQETRAESGALVGAFDQAGNVGVDDGAACARGGIGIGGVDTEVRLEGGEWIRRNFWARGGNS